MHKRSATALFAFILFLQSCGSSSSTEHTRYKGPQSETPMSTTATFVTNEAGDKMALRPNQTFERGAPQGIVIEVDPAKKRQTLRGIGTSFTESSAFVLAHLDKKKRYEVMSRVFGEEGANFSMARTPIGSTDFSVEGKYSYAEVADDRILDSFSIATDRQGFSRQRYQGVVDESYDVLPMIEEALAIKSRQQDNQLRIIASAWTAPPWMKTIDDWYIRPTAERNWQGTGGELKPEYVSTYADYLIRYLDAYRAEGIEIWGLTPVNEPHGNSGQWESMHFTPETQNVFIKDHLGPKLHDAGYEDTKLLIYDQNRDGLEEWTDLMFADKETSPYLYGAAVHWYSSTTRVYEDVFEKVHQKFPGFSIIHTEGTIDDLGKPAGGGVADTVRFKESGWFGNDEFWWNENATDWAYTASWAPDAEGHPIYTPVHRYARDIIVGFNHWLEGWVDWNIVLDEQGGPNHVGNFCGAPVMINTKTGEIYYTPVFHVLSQLSRTIRPGDVAVQTRKSLGDLHDDALHSSASVNDEGLLSVQLLNTTKTPMDVGLKIGTQWTQLSVDANALQTVQVKLEH